MSPKPITENTLFYGDNLFILREHIPSESVDLIYLDPPFNSSRNYNVLFKDEHGTESESQMTAFEDTWHWNLAAEHTYTELLTEAPDHVAKMIESLRGFIGENQMMAYLVMMGIRLIELHRVLRPTGSIFLHCDPTASHYLKVVMDSIFGVKNFRNEIIWHYSGWNKPNITSFMSRHDIIFFYSKGTDPQFFSYSVPYSSKEEYLSVRKQHLYLDEEGKEYTLDTRDGGETTS